MRTISPNSLALNPTLRASATGDREYNADGSDNTATTGVGAVSQGGYGELAFMSNVNGGTTGNTWYRYQYWDSAKQRRSALTDFRGAMKHCVMNSPLQQKIVLGFWHEKRFDCWLLGKEIDPVPFDLSLLILCL